MAHPTVTFPLKGAYMYNNKQKERPWPACRYVQLACVFSLQMEKKFGHTNSKPQITTNNQIIVTYILLKCL